MIYQLTLMSVFLFVSVLVNIFLVFKVSSQKQKPQSQELKDFIRDLTDGAGWAVFRIDPDNILLRSPKR